jgi:MoxR-like ATPase
MTVATPPPSLGRSDLELLKQASETFKLLKREIGKVIIGQEEIVRPIISAVLSQGHTLVVGVPGLAKTLLVKTLAQVLDWRFKRIQFTPDMMPADIIGMELLQDDPTTGMRSMRFVPGPLFANIILADEINRTPPKTQSALLEAMQEYTITSMGKGHVLERPFIVFATQNPIEQEGTYPLPEAQLDRFMMEIRVGYPTPSQEEEIVVRTTGGATKLPDAAFDRDTFLQLRDLVLAVPVPQNVAAFAVGLCGSTRPGDPRAGKLANDYVAWGAGPRGAQNLVLAAKALALLDGRTVPTTADIKMIAVPVLRHRIIVNHRAVGDGITAEQVVERLVSGT